MVFDVTKAASFKNAEKWLQELREHADTDIVIMMVGNKTDLKNQRELATEEAKKFSQKNNLLYIETSALDGSNIKEAFQQTITGMLIYKNIEKNIYIYRLVAIGYCFEH